MNKTNAIGLRVVGITATVFIVLFGLYWAGQTLLDKGASVKTDLSLLPDELTRDTDGDGMADVYEINYYKTDINNSDTDGDGMSDLDEIIAGRDPTIPGPDDVSKPPTGSDITEEKTFTQKYLSSLPTDANRGDILNQVQLEVFVNNNKGVLLPAVTVKTSAQEGKDAISKYLDAVSSTHNDQIGEVTSADIEAAFRIMVNETNLQPAQTIVDILKKNAVILHEITAPREAVALHTKMVATTQALQTNTERILFMNWDFVGGLIAAKNIEELGGLFQEMATEINELEVKYGLE